MRIAFIGKGGSGKTSICATFISWLEAQNKDVLAVDADVNMHLAETLGFHHSKPSLSSASNEIMNELKKRRGGGEDFFHTSIPQDNEWINLFDDHILDPYVTRERGIAFFKIGSYENDEVSAYSCYHTKLTVFEALLHRSADAENEFIVVDATAGIDTVATTLFHAYDLHVVVVEPTRKSVEVAKRYKDLCEQHNQKCVLVANKIENKEDLSFLKSNCGELITQFEYSPFLKQLEQGSDSALDKFVDTNDEQCSLIFKEIPTKRVRGSYFDDLLQSHEIVLDYYHSLDEKEKVNA